MSLITTLFTLLVIFVGLGFLVAYIRDCSRHALDHVIHRPLGLAATGIGIICIALTFRLLPADHFNPALNPLLHLISWVGASLGIICTTFAVFSIMRVYHVKKPTAIVEPVVDSTDSTTINTTKEQVTTQDNVDPSVSAPEATTSPPWLIDNTLNESPIPFFITDNKCRILQVNQAFARLLGEGKENLVGKSIESLVVEQDHIQLGSLLLNTDTKDTQGFSVDLRFKLTKHEPLWVRLYPQCDAQHDNLLLWVEDINENKNLTELLSFHSQYDELTLLHNRSGLEQFLAKAYENSLLSNKIIALIHIDIDKVKVINDTCGYAAGDQLLQCLVSVMKDVCEDCDFFARMGGDEFALVKTNVDAREAKEIAERIRSVIEDYTFEWDDRNYRQSASIGIALSSSSINSVVDLVGAADAACSSAKESGRNRVIMYSESTESSQSNRRDMMWVSRLQKAIQDGSFMLYFQPIEKLNRSEPHVHYECLIRYIDESGRHILPQHFLPAVERFGLSEQVDLWVLTTALDYLDKHPEHTAALDCCSVNLTSQSIANPRIRSAILQVVASYDFPLEKICFEITETSAIHNLSEARDFIGELKTLGCHLALDDFGTGFSSFGYLKNLDVDYLKIDGSFIKDIISDKFDRAMARAINDIGQEMGISIIAEYAENNEILMLLEQMDIGFAQGHAISKPMPLYMLEAYYHSAYSKV